MDKDKAEVKAATNEASAATQTEAVEPINYPIEYRSRMEEILAELEKVRQADEKYLNVGPTYHLQTSKGGALIVDSIYFDFKDKSRRQHRKYYLIAQDTGGQIVGDRSTDIMQLEFNGEKYARADGMLATGKRGGGIATAIESTHLNLLEKEARQLGLRIDWHISNRNLEDLQELREEFRLSPSEELDNQIKEKEAEQRRWQAVYGNGGKLGFDNSGTKTFSQEDPEEKHHPANIAIEQPPTDTDLYNQYKNATIKRVMERMKKVAGG